VISTDEFLAALLDLSGDTRTPRQKQADLLDALTEDAHGHTGAIDARPSRFADSPYLLEELTTLARAELPHVIAAVAFDFGAFDPPENRSQ